MFRKTSLDLSAKELEFIKALGKGSLVEHLPPIAIYKIAMEEMFINRGCHGVLYESLRNVIEAIASMNPLRMTSEFDALISL